MKATSRVLLAVAELLFIGSLVMPSLEIVVLGKPSVWEGWRATFATIVMLGSVAKDPTVLPLGAAGLSNLVFVVAPWLLWFGKSSSQSLRAFACVVVGAVALALWAPYSQVADSPRLLVGYFSWLLAYAALFGSIVVRLANKGAFGKESGAYA